MQPGEGGTVVLGYRRKSWSHTPLDYGKSGVESSYGTVST